METLIQIGTILALFSAAALCVYLIFTLVRLNSVLLLFQRDFSDISRNLKPILENLNFVSERLKSITTKVDDHVNLFKGTLELFKGLAENVLDFEARVQQRLEEPIIRVTTIISGAISRLVSFFGRSLADYSR